MAAAARAYSNGGLLSVHPFGMAAAARAYSNGGLLSVHPFGMLAGARDQGVRRPAFESGVALRLPPHSKYPIASMTLAPTLNEQHAKIDWLMVGALIGLMIVG